MTTPSTPARAHTGKSRLGDHAARDGAVGDQPAGIVRRQLADQAFRLVEHARHVGQKQQPLGPERARDRAREGVGIDVVGDPLLGDASGADRERSAAQNLREHHLQGGITYNVNADTFAGAIAGALGAKRLLLLTDVPGVLDKSKSLIRELSATMPAG